MARGKQTLRAKRTRTSFTYNDKQKSTDPFKGAANDVLCAMTRDLQSFYLRHGKGRAHVRDMRYLVLDGTEMATTKALVRINQAEPENVYICSREVQFQGACRHKYNTHTGELSDFITRMDRNEELMDVVYLDFCGNFSKDNLRSAELLFERRLLEPLCVIAFTVAYKRSRTGVDYFRQKAVEPLDTFRDLARKHGYTVRTTYALRNSKHGMMTYFCKLFHPEQSMSPHPEGADDWAHTDVLPAVLRIMEANEFPGRRAVAGQAF